MAGEGLLASWRDTPTKATIVDVMCRVTTGPAAVPVEVMCIDPEGWTVISIKDDCRTVFA